MKYLQVLTIAVAVFSFGARAEAAAAAAEDEAAAPADLSGYRLCPQCNTLNPPQATYCMRCGAALAGGAEEAKPFKPAAVKGFALAPFAFAGNNEALGGGLRARFDRSTWSYAPSYAYDARWPGSGGYDRHQRHVVRNDARFYFGSTALRPFLGGALDADYYYYRHDYYPYYQRDYHNFVVSFGFGGGVELNYDPQGSFFDVRAFAGPAARWRGGPENNFTLATYLSFYTGNVTYFNRHVGLDVHLAVDAGTGYYAENRLVLEIGPAFTW
jgi:ribosomal protein L40E